MGNNQDTLRPTAIVIALAIVLMLLLQGFPATGANHEYQQPRAPVPKAIGGFVHWPNGTLAKSVPMQVVIKNNQTGETITVSVDTGTAAYTSNVNVNLGDTVYVSCLHSNMWAQNDTVYSGQVFLLCNLSMVGFPFGPQLVTQAAGGSITGYGGAVTLDVPVGSLAADTVIFGVDPLDSKSGSFAAISLEPEGLAFSAPAALTWSYAGMDIGSVPEETLAIYTSNGGPWVELPGFVDTQARQVVAQVSHFSNFSLGGAFAFGNQTDLVNVYPGTIDAPILDLTVINTDLVADETLDYINVLSNSTDDADIAGISLWNDLDNDRSVGAGDAQIGTTLPAGSSNFSALGFNIPADSALNLLVTLDIAAAATEGDFLDLSIPAAGIGLANAGLLEEAIDPTGNVTIATELTDPHVVYGYVMNIFGPLPNVWVNLTNNRTLTVEYLTTDNLGRYEVNLGFMPGGYADWDEIFVQANDTMGQTGWNVTYVDVFMFGERCDLYLGRGPVASDETPVDGATIFDVQCNITLNITSTPVSLDTATIVLGVEGVNYTLAGGNLSFAGDTLTFNTSAAVGNWTDGQVVNVTLWQANDTAGNPCQNAPYTWWFLVSLGVVEDAPDIRVHKAGADINITWASAVNATSYNIYRSLAVDGTGFNFSSPLGFTTATYFIDAGALADGNNYSYVVRGDCAGGEGPKSNIGWKIILYLQNNLATTSNNWISLPYFSDLTTAAALKTDIGTACTKVSRLNLNTQYLDNYLGVPIQNFALQPGIGYQVVVNADTNYRIVGSHNPLVTISLQFNGATTSNNWIALPYHVNLADAAGLKASIGPVCTKVSMINLNTQYLNNYLGVPIQNFPLRTGIGYQVVVTANTVWVPPTRGY